MNNRERDLEDEIRHHLRMAAEDHGAEAARREFGNVTLIKEVTREMWGWTTLDKLAQDLRYAVRTLRNAPALAAVAILSLALGIGANTAIFSLIDAVILKSLPVSHPNELVQVVMSGGQQEPFNTFSNPVWEALRDRQDAFSGIFAYGGAGFNLAAGGEQHNVAGQYVSGDYFSTLGVRPVLGRTLARADDRRGCPGVAVMSYDFWQREYGGAADVLTRTISLDNHPFPVIGVIEPGFYGTLVGFKKDIFVPLCSEKIVQPEYSNLDQCNSWWLNVIGRPKPGVSAAQATAHLSTIAPGIFRDTLPKDFDANSQADYLHRAFRTLPAGTGLSYLRDQYRTALVTLMGVVAVVLLIACANVANLLLARAAVRQKEIAVRLALGAGRARIVRQLLTESLLLSVSGAALGAIFAKWGAGLIVHFFSTGRVPAFVDLTLDLRVLGFTIALALLTGLLFGIAPALRGTRVAQQSAMKEGSRTSTGTRSVAGLGNALVMAQVALSLVLVAAAGLLVGTFRNLETLDPGFDRNHVVLMTVDVRNTTYTKERRAAVYRQILGLLRATPGVHSAATSNIVPISGAWWWDEIRVDGFNPSNSDDLNALFNEVSADYFTTMGTRFLAGRDFNDHDTPTSPHVAIVNASLARKFFSITDVVGRVFREPAGKGKIDMYQIVGVVEDSRYKGLRDPDVATVYKSVNQDSDLFSFTNFEIRAAGSALDLIPTIKAAVGQFNPNIVLSFKTLAAHVDESLARERLLATLSGFFGVLALLLSAIGLYGVMSYRVARRRNEIGIRMALGAARSRIRGMVLRDVAVLLAFGLGAGLAAALAAMRLIATFLYGVSAQDASTLIASALILALVAVAAGYLPARRASRLDPMSALREE